MGYVCFLVYSSNDKDKADEVRAHVQRELRQGDILWFDRMIEGGRPWEAQLHDKLLDAQPNLVIVTPHLFDAPYVGIEISTFMSRQELEGLPFYPLFWEQSEHTAVRKYPVITKGMKFDRRPIAHYQGVGHPSAPLGADPVAREGELDKLGKTLCQRAADWSKKPKHPRPDDHLSVLRQVLQTIAALAVPPDDVDLSHIVERTVHRLADAMPRAHREELGGALLERLLDDTSTEISKYIDDYPPHKLLFDGREAAVAEDIIRVIRYLARLMRDPESDPHRQEATQQGLAKAPASARARLRVSGAAAAVGRLCGCAGGARGVAKRRDRAAARESGGCAFLGHRLDVVQVVVADTLPLGPHLFNDCLERRHGPLDVGMSLIRRKATLCFLEDFDDECGGGRVVGIHAGHP